MKQAIVKAMSEEQIIHYLLNELPKEEAELFEQRSLADRQLFEYMQAVEEDLADAYVHGQLPSERRHSFERVYKATTAGRESIAFATELKDVLDEFKAADVQETQEITKQPTKGFFDTVTEGWQSWVANHRSSWAIPAMAVLLVVIGAISIYKVVRLNQQLGDVQAELAQSLATPPPIYIQENRDRASAVFIPIKIPVNPNQALRGGGAANATPQRSLVKIPIRGNLTELKFQVSNIEFNKYDSYIIELQPDQNSAVKPVILERLKAQKNQEPVLAVPLRVSDFPKDAVTKYILSFRGRGKDGEEKRMESFPVEVDTKE